MAPAFWPSAQYTPHYSVLYHHSVSTGEGHHTPIMFHLNPRGGTSSTGIIGGKAWSYIDERVSSVRDEDVFGHGNDNGKECSDDRCTYLLLYQRAALTWT